MKEKSIDTFMVTVEENRRYLSGFSGEDTQCDETAGALFVTQDQLLLATDFRYETQAQNESPACTVFRYKEGPAKALPEIAGILGSRVIGFESKQISHHRHAEMIRHIGKNDEAIELLPLEGVVEKIRVIKEESEIDTTRKALAIAESAFKKMTHKIRPGMTEKEVAWMMEKNMREAGAESCSFHTIVASGPNSALPHAVPTDRKITIGEPILFDWGAKLDGYCSDTSRTIIIGKPRDPFTRVFNTVVTAQQMAIEAIRSGVSTRDVDSIARDYIEEAGYKGRFGHALGHGTGLAVHEAPRLSPLKPKPLAEGMLVTVEPGIYLPEWGGVRMENQVVVRKDSAEVLNDLDTQLTVLDA